MNSGAVVELSDMGEMEKGNIFQFTGNPFVDAGIWAICEWCQKERPEDLIEDNLKSIVEDIVPLYLTDTWNSSVLHGTIFPNHGKISNPSLKRYSSEERKKKALDYFNNLIKDIGSISNSGSCISCGKREVKKRITKSEIPLTGSTRLINYFSYGVEGADYCLYICCPIFTSNNVFVQIPEHWRQEGLGFIAF